MQALLDLVEKHLGASWRAVVEHLREVNGLNDVARRIEDGDVEGAIHGVEDAAKAFAIDMHAAYVESGTTAAESLDAQIDGALVRFDATNNRAASWADQNTLDKVREVTQEQRDMLRRVHSDGVAAGLNPKDIARDMRDSIGLTDYQAQIVQNYRRALVQGDYADALARELSDGRSDRSVAAAQNAGTALKPEQIDTMVERYRQNWIGYRAETIARTEGLRVAHQGTREAFQQAIDGGHAEAEQLEREWHHTSAGRHPRATHAEMDGQKRGMDEKFESGSGAELLYPGDPDADPSETANCRCAVSTRLVT